MINLPYSLQLYVYLAHCHNLSLIALFFIHFSYLFIEYFDLIYLFHSYIQSFHFQVLNSYHSN